MPKLTLELTMSVDGLIAGPNPTVESPLGEGGERLHEWLVGLAAFRERHGGSGGERNADDELVKESLADVGAVVMGRRMFSGGEGHWEDDPVADGWWGEDPPFHVPVFVLTHHARETVTKLGGTSYSFVPDGIEAALDRARAAAGDRNVSIAGGASVAQQYLNAGLVDEIQIHVAPMFLGDGVRLFGNLDAGQLEVAKVVDSPSVTHIKYRVVK